MTHAEANTIAIDFEGVIHDYKHPLPGKKLGPPMPDVHAAMEELYDRGYGIVIHTVKATTEQGREMVEMWLDEQAIDYHQVTAVKPNAAIFIDDRAIRHTDWPDTLNQVDAIMGYVDED